MTDARGGTFAEALGAALADLLDCDPHEVEVEVRAPGLAGLSGPVRLELTVAGAPSEGPEDEAEDQVPVIAEAENVDEGPAAEDLDAEDLDAEDLDAEAEADEQREEAGAAEREEETGDEPVTIEDLDAEADAAADFLEGLLDVMDLPGDLRIKVHDDHAEVEVVEIGSGALIGRRGQTLEAIQELVRSAVQRRFQRRSRVKVDAEGYRTRRLEKLLEKAEAAIEDALDTGEPQRLEPMDVFERKTVHHLVAEHEGVSSRSQGREPARRVIIEPD